MTITEAIVTIMSIILLGLGYTWLYIDLQKQIERHITELEYCPGLEEDDNKEGSEE